MFCSTVIPTVGRPTLGRAVTSVLQQELDGEDFEVIVVNDTGRPLTEEEWQASPRVQVVTSQRRERSVARNTGAALARGRYLHFLDDDDWLLPGALSTFHRLAEGCPADWLYGSARLVDRHTGADLGLLHHHLMQGNCAVQTAGGEWIPLQTSLVAASAFFRAGGFDPEMPRGQDKNLAMRIALQGEVMGIETAVCSISIGSVGSLSNITPERRRQVNARSRERILSQPGAFGRLNASADSTFWRGKLVRMYLISLCWNLHLARPFTCMSRLAYLVPALVLSGGSLLSVVFWGAVTHGYDTPVRPPARDAIDLRDGANRSLLEGDVTRD